MCAADDPDTAPVTLTAEVTVALGAIIQARLEISRTVFASRFGISVATLQDWEEGRQTPDRKALAV